MTAKRSADTRIKEVETQGRTRYRVVVDTGFHADGRRRQTTKTFDTRRAAKDWLAQTRTEVRESAYVPRTSSTRATGRCTAPSWPWSRRGSRLTRW